MPVNPFPESSESSTSALGTRKVLIHDQRFDSEVMQKYVMGGKKFASKSEGAATVKLQEGHIPIVSFTGVSLPYTTRLYRDF